MIAWIGPGSGKINGFSLLMRERDMEGKEEVEMMKKNDQESKAWSRRETCIWQEKALKLCLQVAF